MPGPKRIHSLTEKTAAQIDNTYSIPIDKTGQSEAYRIIGSELAILTGAANTIHDNVAGEINAITVKGTPVSADKIIIEDSAASWAKKGITIGSLPGGGGGDFSDGGDVAGADRTLGNTDNYDLGFLTNNLNRLHIQNDGLIGIGTTSPGEILHISKDQNGFVGLEIQNEQGGLNSSSGFNFDVNGADSWFFMHDPARTLNRYGFTLGGWVEIVTGSGDLSKGIVLATRNAEPFVIATNTTERMRVDSAGKVGVGTASPATSALLELSSTTGALLIPRMTTTQKNALTAVNGMIIYDSILNKFQGYENGSWTSLI